MITDMNAYLRFFDSVRRRTERDVAALPPDEIRSAAEGTPSKPATNQGKLQARGAAQMFQA